MRCVVQRVTAAQVEVDGSVVGQIGHGLLVLVGIEHGDGDEQVEWMAKKLLRLRIFDDADGRFDRSLTDVGGAVLSVSQFTLFGDVRKGTRPSFTGAASPEQARVAWVRFNRLLETAGIDVATGIFGASMQVSLVNDGPVTLTIDRRAATQD